MTLTSLPLPAKSTITDIRQLLTPSSQIYASYVHFFRPEHVVFHDYCNMSDGLQKVTAVLLTVDGRLVPGLSPRIYGLQSQDILNIDTSTWARSLGLTSFSGQLILLVDQIESQGSKPIYPAITAHWLAASHHCKIATAAFGHINTAKNQGKKSFFMYCSMAVVDSERTTYIVLFNHSTDSTYQDVVEVDTALAGMKGQQLEGAPAKISPFGVLVLDIQQHFGIEGTTFLANNQGHISVLMRHRGHTLPAYFFHVSRKNLDILSGQHAQPPIAAFTHFGIWWGKLRRYSF